jgi:hypothetical protein
MMETGLWIWQTHIAHSPIPPLNGAASATTVSTMMAMVANYYGMLVVTGSGERF